MHQWLGLFVFFLAIAFLALGVLKPRVAKDHISALLPIVLLLPAVICFVQTKVHGLFIYEWYLIFVLPGVIAFVALGIDQVSTLVRSRIGRVAATSIRGACNLWIRRMVGAAAALSHDPFDPTQP